METIKRGVKPKTARQLLPQEAYTSQSWFDKEQRDLFSKVWTFACSMDDVPNPGDYYCVQVGLYPMVVIHGRDGNVRALHNVCRHRGAAILEGTGNMKGTLTCPYHRWSYNTDGKLRGIPQQQELFDANIKKCELNLKAGSLGNFRNLLFIHPQAVPDETFDEYLADLPEHSWPAKTENLKVITRVEWAMNCNWKSFVENAQDGYHLSHLHKDTLQGPTTQAQDWRPHGRHWHWSGNDSILQTSMERMTTKEKAKVTLNALMTNWTPLEGVDINTYGGEVFGFFPSFLVQPLLDNVGFAKLVPVSPTKTLLEVFIMVAPWKNNREKAQRLKTLADFAPLPGVGYRKDGNVNIDRPITLKDIEGHALDSGNFHIEDVWQVEMVNKGTLSPAYEVGPLSGANGETALTYFQQMVLDYLAENADKRETQPIPA
ncbi:hypothetical protein R50073_25560 [Maricurvus nonylphenolicus]|uniref:aromatic ring-hydroxylating oxygenase subunit alpha n=1 Tax=Maricurvus nonylphenolicus TaxID=1008307 RepID=UPI0036F36986